jgi:uracil phosphoribosyltransferase
LMREKSTSTASFRNLMGEIGLLLGYEVTRELPMSMVTIETPLATMQAPVLEGKKLVIVPILRAGLGIVDSLLHLLPSARVGHIGLYRDPETLEPVEYYLKVPEAMEDRDVIIVDPMLATGHSAAAATARIKETNPRSIKFLCLLAAPEGLKCFHEQHPDVPIYTAAVDDHLNDHGYIVPGLGDAGDRLYGTK